MRGGKFGNPRLKTKVSSGCSPAPAKQGNLLQSSCIPLALALGSQGQDWWGNWARIRGGITW